MLDTGVIARCIRMFDSLNETIYKAGGVGIKSEELSKMTVLELITKLGPNDIIFKYEPLKKDKKND